MNPFHTLVPNTEPAQDKVNRPFGPWHDLVNKVISHEPIFADPWHFRRTLQKVQKAAIAKIRSPALKTGGTGHKTYMPPMCGRGLTKFSQIIDKERRYILNVNVLCDTVQSQDNDRSPQYGKHQYSYCGKSDQWNCLLYYNMLLIWCKNELLS